jgi:hypothetical protein
MRKGAEAQTTLPGWCRIKYVTNMKKNLISPSLKLACLLLLSPTAAQFCQAQLTWGTDGAGTTATPSLWLRADAGTTTSGSAVSAWADQSGNAFNVSNDILAQEPALVASSATFNNQAVLHFDGSTKYLYNLSVLGTDLIGTDQSTIFIVQLNNGGQSAALAWNQVANTANQMAVNAPYDAKIFFDHGSTVNADNPPGFVSNPHIVTLERNVSAGTIRVDGTPLTLTPSTFTTAIDNTGAGYLQVGGFNGAVLTPPGGFIPMNGDIAEVLVFKTALSGADINTVENYLGGRYGISAVPEPSQYAAVFAGVCMIVGLALRHRRQTA